WPDEHGGGWPPGAGGRTGDRGPPGVRRSLAEYPFGATATPWAESRLVPGWRDQPRVRRRSVPTVFRRWSCGLFEHTGRHGRDDDAPGPLQPPACGSRRGAEVVLGPWLCAGRAELGSVWSLD